MLLEVPLAVIVCNEAPAASDDCVSAHPTPLLQMTSGLEPSVPVQSLVAAAAPDAAPRRFATLDRILATATEVPAAALVGVEILVLLTGVIARYVFNAPLTWSDELASTLFLWLAMLGAVIALRRSEHMRLGFVVGLLPVRFRRFVDTLATMVVAVFLLAMISPARDYVDVQSFITTPALEISDSFRVAAIGVGMVLMLVIVCARLIERATPAEAAAALALILIVGAGLWFAQSMLATLGNLNLVIFFVVMVGGLCRARRADRLCVRDRDGSAILH